MTRFTVSFDGVMDRLEELERENHVTRAIVVAVANSNPYGGWYPATNGPAGVVCRWCMERAQTPKDVQHDYECTWRQARALMGDDAS